MTSNSDLVVNMTPRVVKEKGSDLNIYKVIVQIAPLVKTVYTLIVGGPKQVTATWGVS